MPSLIGLFPSRSRASGLFTSIVRRFCRLRGGSLSNWFECLADPVPSKDNSSAAGSLGHMPEPGISWFCRPLRECCHPQAPVPQVRLSLLTQLPCIAASMKPKEWIA
jgi:hypothetical protein